MCETPYFNAHTHTHTPLRTYAQHTCDATNHIHGQWTCMTANSVNDNTVRHEEPETHNTLVFPFILGIREVSGHLHTSSTHRMDSAECYLLLPNTTFQWILNYIFSSTLFTTFHSTLDRCAHHRYQHHYTIFSDRKFLDNKYTRLLKFTCKTLATIQLNQIHLGEMHTHTLV